MYEVVGFHIKGMTATLMHNGRLANPLDPIAKALKQITAKRKKTDADYEEMARLEFLGSLYTHPDTGVPCWPGENLERMLVDAAKKSKEGQIAKTGILCDGYFPLIYTGPTDPEKLWESEQFRLTSPAKVNNSRVMRTRPIFRVWELKFDVHYLPDVVNRETVRQWVNTAGQLIALSDWRPKFGRFEVVA